MLHSCGGTATGRPLGGVHARQDIAAARRTAYSRVLEDAMAFQPAPDCAEVVVKQTLQGIEVRNILTFRKTTGYSQADLDALADSISTNWGSEMLVRQYTAMQFNGVDVRGLTLQNDLFGSSALGAGVGGTSTGTPFPNNVAYCLKFVTAFTGRSARGRIYIAGLGTIHAEANENYITSTAQTQLRTAIQNICTSVPAGWQHVIVSRTSNGAPRATAVAFEVLTYQTTDALFDTQRRRMA